GDPGCRLNGHVSPGRLRPGRSGSRPREPPAAMAAARRPGRCPYPCRAGWTTSSDRKEPREPDPFTALGLPASPHLDDEQVRAAWRAAAAAAHPDRGDGGDPAAYTAASAAYARLRTPWGRSEALADLAASPPVPPPDLTAARP